MQFLVPHSESVSRLQVVQGEHRAIKSETGFTLFDLVAHFDRLTAGSFVILKGLSDLGKKCSNALFGVEVMARENAPQDFAPVVDSAKGPHHALAD